MPDEHDSNLKQPGLTPTVLIALCLLTGIIQVWFLWGTQIPLGVPDEWTWPRIPFSSASQFNLVLTAITGAVYLSYVSWAANRLKQSSFWISIHCLTMSFLGFFWIMGAVSAGDEIHGLGRSPFVLFYERTSGYFTQARDDVSSATEFLKTYQDRISDSNVPENYLHQGTHPPGLTLAYYGLIKSCEQNESLVNLAQITQPESVQGSLSTIKTNSLASGIPFTPVHQATIWWAILITALLGALTTWPLFLLLRMSVSNEAAWWTTAMWPLIPAVSIFLPKSDVLYPVFAVLLQWIWLVSLNKNSWWLGVFTGVIMFCSLNLTLAFAPIGVILGLQFLLHFWRTKQITAVSGFLIALFGSVGLCWMLLETNLIGIWLQNLRNHAAFYDHSTRSYLPWLIANPIELTISVGAPVATLAILGIWQSRQTDSTQNHNLWIATSVWALLWLSGKNMGEAARLWIFLMPIALWATAYSVQSLVSTSNAGRKSLLVCLVIQILVCIITVLRVDGFHMDQI